MPDDDVFGHALLEGRIIERSGRLYMTRPRPLTHSHDFVETIRNDETGLDRRCRCGARLWEPAALAAGKCEGK